MGTIAQVIIYITYLGTASFLIDTGQMRILTDPGDFFTNRFTEAQAKALADIDLILVTHADFDHVNRLALIPDAVRTRIMGTESVKKSFPSLTVFTGSELDTDGVSIRRVHSIHGVRHDVDHSSYLITIGNVTILFLGDAYRLIDKVEEHVDIMFVTLSGFEASPENAVKLAAEIKPDAVIAMHWEVLFRTDEPALRLCKLLGQSQPDTICFVPEFDKRFIVKKQTRIGIERE